MAIQSGGVLAINPANNAIYLTDPSNHRVRKLVLNNPASLQIVTGDNQTGAPADPPPIP